MIMIITKSQLKRYIDRKVRDGILEHLKNAGKFIAPVAVVALGIKLISFLTNRSQDKSILNGEMTEGEYLDQIKGILLADKAVSNNPQLGTQIARIKSIDGLIKLDEKVHFNPSPRQELLQKKALFRQARERR